MSLWYIYWLIWSFCDPIKAALLEKSEGYIQVFLDGGLNQQKMGFSIKSLLSRSKVWSCVCVKDVEFDLSVKLSCVDKWCSCCCKDTECYSGDPIPWTESCMARFKVIDNTIIIFICPMDCVRWNVEVAYVWLQLLHGYIWCGSFHWCIEGFFTLNKLCFLCVFFFLISILHSIFIGTSHMFLQICGEIYFCLSIAHTEFVIVWTCFPLI